MALLHSLALFAGVTVAAGAMTVAGINFTAETVTRSMADLPRAKVHVRPSYVGSLQPGKAVDLDIARSVPATPADPDVKRPDKAAGAIHTVDANSLWVRMGPDKSTGRKFLLRRGATVTVTGRQGKWFAVTTPDGRSGWAFCFYLKAAPGGGTTAAAR